MFAAPRLLGARCARLVSPLSQPSRLLNIHEYQGKDLMRRHGLTVQRGSVASSAAEARGVAEGLTAGKADPLLVVKAQVHAGGRGKGVFKDGFKGGVKLVRSAAEAEEVASRMIGGTIVTPQTGEDGAKVEKVLVLEAIDVLEKEFYLAIVLDRGAAGPVIVASRRGGVDIEAVAEEDPSAIHKSRVDISTGVTDAQALSVALELSDGDAALAERISREILSLYKLFTSCDATQVEINPLAVTGSGDVVSVDAKINFDDSAEPRQAEIFAMQDPAEGDPREAEAGKWGMSYISLPGGSIGALVNGAGLAMATCDAISLHGGKPANFCDLGGGATADGVAAAFRLISSDPSVTAILVNIFGGIVKCDLIAEGITQAARTIDLKVPLVVRLAGTNAERGRQILEESGIPLTTAGDLDEASIFAVRAAGESQN